MSTDNKDDKYSGIPSFDGTEEDYPEFEIKFMSFLETKDLEEYALEDMDVPEKATAKAARTAKDGASEAPWEKYQEDKRALAYLKRYLKGSPLLLIKDCRMCYDAYVKDLKEQGKDNSTI